MIKVSLAILVHDESAFLEKFLKSTVGYFDEIVAVIDQPAKQLERILKKYQVKYSYKKFSDFSSQRNYAAKLASNDWIFSLDIDETLDGSFEKFIKKFNAQSELDKRFLYYFPRKNIDKDYKCNIFKTMYPKFKEVLYNRKNTFWRGEVHEYLSAKGKLIKKFVPVHVYHHVYLHSANKKNKKFNMYKKLYLHDKYFQNPEKDITEKLSSLNFYLFALYFQLGFIFKPWLWLYPVYWLINNYFRLDKLFNKRLRNEI